MKIIVDAMGGDNAPEEPVKAAVEAVKEKENIQVILTGVQDVIEAELRKYPDYPKDRIRVVHASQVIETAEPPVMAIQKKKDSSIVVGLNLVKKQEADAFVSSGSTGAVLVGGQVIVGRIKGIRRPPLAPLIPTAKGVSLLIDCGANVDARPDHLVQFAQMGSIYMEHVVGIKNPRVGIVNIGVEEEVNYNPTLEIGDFLCKDGTTIDKDYNLEQLDEAVKASIIGVVYYVGNPQPSVLYNGTYTETQDVLKRECPSCVNGLAIALNNAISKSGAVSGRFGSTKSDYKEWLNTQDYASGYIDATLSINNVPTKIVGYNNTKVTELAADNVGGLGTDFVDFLNTYRTTVVIEEGKTSGWYLPSYEELNIIENNYAVISASITKIGGSLLQYSDYDAVASDRFYWTSDFRGSSNAWISPLCAVAEGTNLFIGRVSNGTKGFFRFAVAF